VTESEIGDLEYTFWGDPDLVCNWPRSVFETENYDPIWGTTTTRAHGVQFRGDEIVVYLRGDKAKFETYWPIPADPLQVPQATPLAGDAAGSKLIELEPDNVSLPPVSPATLAAWWAMCQTIMPSGQWNADEMRVYFQQCFPDKSVTRDRLRKVRESPKSGPKPNPAE
jgi:hypothetical protein